MLNSELTYSEIAGENFSQNQARMMSNQKLDHEQQILSRHLL
jgi:hypothetical protein